jgi:type II secretory pathway pseudopilin PulG
MRSFAPKTRKTHVAAMTVAEVLVAATILSIVVAGVVAFVIHARVTVERAAQKRTAAKIATERLEYARAGGYDALSNDAGNVIVESTAYTWTLTVTTALADPADSGSVYKQLQISVDWPTSDGGAVSACTAMPTEEN